MKIKYYFKGRICTLQTRQSKVARIITELKTAGANILSIK